MNATPIVPQKPDEESAVPAPGAQVEDPPHAEKNKAVRRIPWAELLSRVFAIDMKHCPKCHGELKPLAAIMEISAIRKILKHLGLPDEPPDIMPARLSPQMSF